jgi:TRAP-type C4-dicarboxylate transport system permease large subunit
MMTREGAISRGYAAAITAASATIGPIIPPSIPMVLYALVSNTRSGAVSRGDRAGPDHGRRADGDERR